MLKEGGGGEAQKVSGHARQLDILTILKGGGGGGREKLPPLS